MPSRRAPVSSKEKSRKRSSSRAEAATADMRDHAFIADALYRVKSSLGERRDKAAQLFAGPTRSQEPAWLAFQELGFAHIANGKSDAGIGILERGYDGLQRPPRHSAAPLRVPAHRSQGKGDGAGQRLRLALPDAGLSRRMQGARPEREGDRQRR